MNNWGWLLVYLFCLLGFLGSELKVLEDTFEILKNQPDKDNAEEDSNKIDE